jgi:hypothetical protein
VAGSVADNVVDIAGVAAAEDLAEIADIEDSDVVDVDIVSTADDPVKAETEEEVDAAAVAAAAAREAKIAATFLLTSAIGCDLIS